MPVDFADAGGGDLWSESNVGCEIQSEWPGTRIRLSVVGRDNFGRHSGNEQEVAYKEAIRQQAGHYDDDFGAFPGVSVSLSEMSSDDMGFPCAELHRKGKGDIERYPKIDSSSGVMTARAYKLVGRIWKFVPREKVIPWSTWAHIISLVTLGHDGELKDVVQCAVPFLARFVFSSPTSPWTNWINLGRDMFHAQAHFRCFSTKENENTSSCITANIASRWTPLYKRDHGVISSPGTRSLPDLPIVETRFSAAILGSLSHSFYSMVVLTDKGRLDADSIALNDHWGALGLELCDVLRTVSIWQAAIGVLIREWSVHWAQTLSEVASRSQPTVEDIADSINRQERYCVLSSTERHALQQLLAKFKRTIREAVNDLKTIQCDFDRSLTAKAAVSPTVQSNWKALHVFLGDQETTLLLSIDEQQRELDLADRSGDSSASLRGEEERCCTSENPQLIAAPVHSPEYQLGDIYFAANAASVSRIDRSEYGSVATRNRESLSSEPGLHEEHKEHTRAEASMVDDTIADRGIYRGPRLSLRNSTAHGGRGYDVACAGNADECGEELLD
ncbi:hypothetical protein PWT90_04189 [Aphanocladium album]|nr:hypothetical protein PWT90_04189 [Aphanocladium album]